MSAQGWQENCLSYIGRTRQHRDVLTVNTANCLLATLNDSTTLKEGDSLPPLFHWVYFNEPVLAEDLKFDGHEKLGDFLPPVPYPKRMWAGSEVSFLNDLTLGLETIKHSTIKSVTFKTGTSGALCFVAVEHVYQQAGQDCLIDVHTIVYKEDSGNSKSETVIAEVKHEERHDQSIGAVTLFRYSALTFNAHLIHYDAAYAKEEGYPGLVVHGPLIATLLMRHALAAAPNKKPGHFRFRGLAPVFADDRFSIQNESTENGRVMLQLTKQGDVVAMKSAVEWQQ